MRAQLVSASVTKPLQYSTIGHPSFRHQLQWRMPTSPTRSVASITTLRFASTTSIEPSPPSTESFPVAADGFLSPSLDEITADIPLIPERLGYLKDLGLDYGWGPTAFNQWMLEHVHVLTGAPWWASALLAALCIRLVLLKPYIEAADTSARVATLSDILLPLRDRVKAARERKDQHEMMVAASEIRAVYRKASIKLWKLAIPFVQVPIGFGAFRLFRGMVTLPVPGLEQGGFLWIQDLTISDPYFVLPAVFALALHTTFRVSTEKVGVYGVPIILTILVRI